MRHCVGEITGLIQVPHDTGSLKIAACHQEPLGAWEAAGCRQCGQAKEGGQKATPLEMKLAFRGSCRH